MIKAIIFDADGVLIHAEAFSRQLQRDYGIPYTKLDPFFDGEFKQCLIGGADLKEVLKPHVAQWGWQGTVDELLEYWFRVEYKIDQDLIDYIAQLRKQGIYCVLATNQEKYRAEYMLTKMGFGQALDGVYASAHLGHKKPALEFFAKLHEKLPRYDKPELLFWDDNQENVDGAREFGIQAELYTSFADFKNMMNRYIKPA